MPTSKKIAIVGVAESDEIGVVPNKSSLQHHAEAAYNALDDCGLNKDDVDGLFTAGLSTMITGEYMGIRPSFADSTYVGGSSFVVHVAHAVAAIAAGYCEVAMITHGQAGRSGRTRPAEDRARPYVQYEVPYGITHPPMYYSMMCRRYMHDYGEDRTREAMAEIAVATRKWARLNPRALMHDRPMEPQDYHDSPWICWPFHLLDCCLVTDAGAAVVITTEERARDLRKKPVMGAGRGGGPRARHGQPDGRPHHVHRRRDRPQGDGDGRRLPLGRRSGGPLRLVHLHRARQPGGAGLLRPRRGPRFRPWPAHRARRRLPAEHQRRRPVVHPPGDVRHLHRRRGGQTAPRRVRRPPGRRLQNGHRARHRRRDVVHRHGRPGEYTSGYYQ